MKKKLFRALRLLGLALLIVLAVLGVGLTGAAVAFQPKRRPLDPEVKIELIEKKRDETKDAKKLDIVKR